MKCTAFYEALEGNMLTGEVINQAIDRVIANDTTLSQSQIDAANSASQAEIQATQVASDAEIEAIEAQTDAISKVDPATGDRTLNIPDFCTFGKPICDFVDWVKTDPQTPPEDGDIEPEQADPTMHQGILERLYINMPASCPPDPILTFMGANIPFPMSVFCQFASMMKPLILLFAYIKGLSIIGTGLS